VFYQLRRLWLVPLLLSMVILGLDQASKYWIIQTLGPQPLTDAIPLIGDWFRFIYSRNTGVAFSLFQNIPQFLTIVALGITAGVIYAYARHMPNRSPLIQVSVGLIVGGALGNVIDRLRLGYVVDFIQVGWWPVFNIADSAICVGAALLLLGMSRIEAAQRRREQVTV
jgi:signal peptidase II